MQNYRKWKKNRNRKTNSKSVNDEIDEKHKWRFRDKCKITVKTKYHPWIKYAENKTEEIDKKYKRCSRDKCNCTENEKNENEEMGKKKRM